MSRASFRIIRTLLLVYVGFVLVMTGCQRHLIYYPSRGSVDRLEAIARSDRMHAWRAEDGGIIGWKSPQDPDPAKMRAVLVFHGNAGYALHRTYFVHGFQGLPDAERWAVHIFEYPGYGARTGRPGEQAIQTAATEAVEQLFAVGHEEIYLVGESLGGGVACHLAARFPGRISGLLLITPFTSLVDVGRHHYPFLPVRIMLRDKFDNHTALEGYSGPIAFLVAGRDEIVPAKLGRRLYESYAGPKRLWVQEQSTHNTLVYAPGAAWWREVTDFLVGNADLGQSVP